MKEENSIFINIVILISLGLLLFGAVIAINWWTDSSAVVSTTVNHDAGFQVPAFPTERGKR